MEFKQITDTTNREFLAAMDIYSSAFPANERHSGEVIEARVKKGLSQVYVGSIEDDVVFMALLWPLLHTDFILLDYIATHPLHRGKNIASSFLREMRRVSEEQGKYFVLEVENPGYGDNKDERQKRLEFYRKNGAKEIKDVRYILPPLQGNTPTEMLLMIFPGYQNGKIDAGLVRQLIVQIYRELYNRDAEEILIKHFHFDTGTQIDLI